MAIAIHGSNCVSTYLGMKSQRNQMVAGNRGLLRMRTNAFVALPEIGRQLIITYLKN